MVYGDQFIFNETKNSKYIEKKIFSKIFNICSLHVNYLTFKALIQMNQILYLKRNQLSKISKMFVINLKYDKKNNLLMISVKNICSVKNITGMSF